MHSCIYDGNVHHQRFGNVKHTFRYSLFLMYLDLDEIDDVFRSRWLWSTRRPAFARFRRADHLGDPNVPLSECVRDLVEIDTGFRPAGPVRLLTHLRYLGIVMNPVSFYYCFDETDATVEAIVAEVNNTPWGERHCYVFDARNAYGTIRAERAKDFHVSPFLSMDMEYRWLMTAPGERLAVHIENLKDGIRAFDAKLCLRRRPITAWQLARVLMRYPLMTIRVAAAIHWQALRLWWKGATFHAHPDLARQSGVPDTAAPAAAHTTTFNA